MWVYEFSKSIYFYQLISKGGAFASMSEEETVTSSLPDIPAGKSKPTLRTVAEKTGLAVTTVSRALNNAPEIALKTRQRVHKAAAQIGYEPDRAAQRLRTGRTNVISLVLAPHEEILGFGTSLIAGLTQSFRGSRYHLVVMPYFDGEDAERPIRQIVRNQLADAVVFCRTEPLDSRVRLLLEHDFPFISHGRTELATPHAYVDYDNFTFAYKAALRLIEKGVDRIILVNAPKPYTFSQHMLHGFMTAVRESGVAYEVATDLSIDSPPNQLNRFAKQRLARKGTSGFVCGGEVSALAVMAAITDQGLTIGQDAHLVAKRTTPIFDQLRPAIDMIGEDLIAAGGKLGDLLLKRLSGGSSENLQFLQAPKIMFQNNSANVPM